MRRVLGLLGFALALPWVACEDRTVPLSQADTLTTSSGGTGGSGGAGGTAGGTSTTSSATLAGPSSTQGLGGSSFGPTVFGTFTVTSTTVSHSFGAGGDGDVDGGHGVESGGSNGFPMGGIPSTSGGNEGGQGPECHGEQCLCNYAKADCAHPTPECPEEDWLRKCGKCELGCGANFTCFLGIECRATCLGEGTCGLGQYCDEALYACVDCTTDDHCAAQFGKVCLAGHCVECAGSGDCTNSDRPYCIAGTCRECVSPDDCDGGSCNANARCVDCQNDEECVDETHPFCRGGACTECRYDTDCEPGETCSDSSFTCSPRD